MDVKIEISPNDEMLGDNPRHYHSVGISALAQILAALDGIGNPKVHSILDLPCGHGRVLRHLKANFPQAQLFAADLLQDGVDFCVKTFDAIALETRKDFDELNYGRNFDLIWVGSLITHLSAANTTKFLRFALRHLSETGVAIVSSHGSFVVGRSQMLLTQGHGAYGMDYYETGRALNEYFTFGVGYGSYHDSDDGYGHSFISRKWFEQTVPELDGRLVFYRDHAWDNHHDIIAFTRIQNHAAGD